MILGLTFIFIGVATYLLVMSHANQLEDSVNVARRRFVLSMSAYFVFSFASFGSVIHGIALINAAL